jgi:hypothetical protein
MKNTFNIFTHWRNANQNYIEILLHASQKGTQTPQMLARVEKKGNLVHF